VYVLDTNTVVCFFKGAGRVASRLLETPPDRVAIPSVVLYELEVAAAGSAAPKARRGQLDALASAVAILPFGVDEARVAATLRNELERKGAGIGPLDTLIAATALSRGATLVTHNQREFKRITGLKTEDWYA
jgi:tRNA(fMet)-specific endonuclease VapC